MEELFLRVLSGVNLPSLEDENEFSFLVDDRSVAIRELLRGTPFEEEMSGYVQLYSHKDSGNGPCILLSAHRDSVYEPHPDAYDLRVKGDRLSGTLDNTAGIAFIISAALLGRLGPNTLLAFAGGEEGRDAAGARHLVQVLRNNGIEPALALVLEVTGDNFEWETSLENLFAFPGNGDLEGLDRFLRRKKIKAGFIPEGDWDEAYAYHEEGIPACTVALPVAGDFHTANAWTTLSKCRETLRALCCLCKYWRNFVAKA